MLYLVGQCTTWEHVAMWAWCTKHMRSRGMNAACDACTSDKMLTDTSLQQLVCMHAYAHTYMHVCVCTHAWVRRRAIYVHGHSCAHTLICIRPHMSMQTCMFTHDACLYAWPSYLHTYRVCETEQATTSDQQQATNYANTTKYANNDRQTTNNLNICKQQ